MVWKWTWGKGGGRGKNDLSLQTALSHSSLSSIGNLRWQIQRLIAAPTEANGKIPCWIQWEKDQTPNLDCRQQRGANVSLNRANLVSFLPRVFSANCQLSVESRLFIALEESGWSAFAKLAEFEALQTSWNIHWLCRTWLTFASQFSSAFRSGLTSSPGHRRFLWVSVCPCS